MACRTSPSPRRSPRRVVTDDGVDADPATARVVRGRAALEDLAEFLSDGDPAVRRNALSVLSECTEDDEWAQAAPYFAAALSDPSDEVRAAAMKLLRELVEVIEPGAEFVRHLRRAAAGPDPGSERRQSRRCGGTGSAEKTNCGHCSTIPTRPCAVPRSWVSSRSIHSTPWPWRPADAASAVRLAAARGFAAVGIPVV